MLGTFERGLQRSFSFLDVTADVFDHDDGIVHDETGRNGQRHERKVVEAVAEQIHHAKGANQRERNSNAGNDGGADAAEEKKNHHHDEGDGKHQSELHILDGRADRGCAVGEDVHLNCGGKRSLQLRQKFFHSIDHGDDVRAGLPLNI